MDKSKIVAAKTPDQLAGALWDKLTTKGYTIPRSFRDGKFLRLLRRVEKGMFAQSTLNNIFENADKLVCGPASSVFFPDKAQLFTMIIFQHDVLGEDYYISDHGRANKISVGGQKREAFECSVNEWVYAIKKEEKHLPYDMREWPDNFVRAFFRARLGDSETRTVSDQERSLRLLGHKPLKEKLHNIRRINSKPSKIQQRIIERQNQKDNVNISDTYSKSQ